MKRFLGKSVRNHGGYIALLSAVIISFILLALAMSVSQSGYFSRFNSLNSEFKRVGLGLAESCTNMALLRIAENYNYAPAPGGDVVAVGSDDCVIKSVTYGAEDATHRRTASILTQAEYKGAWSEVKVAATVQNPTFSPHSRATLVAIVHVVNDDGGTKTADMFTLNINASNPSSSTVVGSETGVVVAIDPVIHYDVTLPFVAGYTQSSSAECSGVIALGGTGTCVITLNDISTQATLTVEASVKNDNGGVKLPSDAYLTINGTHVTLGVPVTLAPGTHTVSAQDMPGYTQSSWGYHCAPGGSVTLVSGENKVCVVSFDDIPPPSPSCADTVMMLDRTGSMSSGNLTDERTAAKALLDLYGALSPHPQVGIGRFGGGSGSTADIFAQLTASYGTNGGITASTSLKYPTATASTSQWASGGNGFAVDGQFATTSIVGRLQSYKDFSFGLPADAIISGVEVEVNGMVIPGYQLGTFNFSPINVGAFNPSQWSVSSGPSSVVNKVNYVTDVNASTYIVTSASTTQTFALGGVNLIPIGATINSIQINTKAYRNGSGSPTMSFRVEKGSGAGDFRDYPVAGTISNTTEQTYSSPVITVDPFTGQPWTATQLANWGFGVSKTNTTGTLRVSQFSVTVNYSYIPTIATADVGVNLSWGGGSTSTWTTQKVVTLSTVQQNVTLGGVSDNWGRSWTATNTLNSNFVLRLTNNTASGTELRLDAVAARITYTTPSSGLYQAIDANVSSNSSGGTNLISALNVGQAELTSVRHDITKEKALIIITDGMPNQPSNDTNAVLSAADTVKLTGTKIFTIHFGGTSGRDLTAKMANGTTSVAGHQNGSTNNAGTSNSATLVNSENADGDNFFISPDSAAMANVFQIVGKAACPAVAAPPPPPPTRGTVVVSVHTINDNGGPKVSRDFIVNVLTGTNSSTSTFVGAEPPGTIVTFDPGAYQLSQPGAGGYSVSIGLGCSGTLQAGDTLTCNITNDDAVPPPPPPPPPPPSITIGAWEEATSTPP